MKVITPEIERGGIHDMQVHIDDAELLDLARQLREHGLGEINPGDSPGRSDGLGQAQCHRAGAGGDVENLSPGAGLRRATNRSAQKGKNRSAGRS